MATLRRAGAPYELSAGDLLRTSMVTSGAITNRVDRMEAKGLVARVRDDSDRRSTHEDSEADEEERPRPRTKARPIPARRPVATKARKKIAGCVVHPTSLP